MTHTNTETVIHYLRSKVTQHMKGQGGNYIYRCSVVATYLALLNIETM